MRKMTSSVEDEDPLGDFSLDPAEEERLAAQKAAEERARQEEAQRAEEEQRRKEMEEQARRLAMEAEAKRLAEQAMTDDSQMMKTILTLTLRLQQLKLSKKKRKKTMIQTFLLMSLNQPERKPNQKKSQSPKQNTNLLRTTVPSSRTKKSSSVRSGRIDAAATLTGKVGGGNFQTLNFVTYGGEIGIHLSEAVSVHIGGEGYATNQAMPVLDEDGEPTDVLQQSWRVLIPVSLGVEYHFEGKMAKPYVGADMQILPAYAGTGSGAAIGLRGRAGSNFMVAEWFWDQSERGIWILEWSVLPSSTFSSRRHVKSIWFDSTDYLGSRHRILSVLRMGVLQMFEKELTSKSNDDRVRYK